MSSISEQSAAQMPRAVLFATIVRTGSMTAAAAELGMSKSVVSAQLKELEHFLGVRLLERTTRTQRLTAAGTRLLPRVRAMADAWASGITEVRATRDAPSGSLRLTTPTHLYEAMVGPAIAVFAAEYPSVVLRADVSDERRALGDDFDLALRVGPSAVPSNHRVRTLGEDRDIVVARRDVDVGRPEQLIDQRWIVHAQLPRSRTFEGPRDERIDLLLPRHIEVGSAPAIRRLALEGAGVAIVPETLVRGDLAAGTLVRLVPEWHAGTIAIHAIMPSAVAPNVERFLETLREMMATSR